MTDVDLDAPVTVRDDVACEVLDGEAVILATSAGRLHRLDRIGTLVFQCFDGVATLGEIVDDVADVFAVPRDEVAADVTRLASRLLAEGIIAIGDTQAPGVEQLRTLPNPPHR